MKKNVNCYKQKGSTCSICSMLMVLDYYKKLNIPKWYFERKYYKIYKSKYTIGTPLSAVCYHLAKNNFECKLFHSENTIFKNDNYMNEELFNNLLSEYKEFITLSEFKGAQVKNGININIDLLKRYLNSNYFIILSGMVNNSLHNVLLIGYDESNFYVCDPLYKKESIWDNKKVKEFIKTPIGSWCLMIRNG